MTRYHHHYLASDLSLTACFQLINDDESIPLTQGIFQRMNSLNSKICMIRVGPILLLRCFLL